MMMDDDVVCEPEGIIRAVTFGDLAKRPTIVGGHMFSLYSRSRLHSFGEIVQPWRFWWQTRLDGYSHWDFAARNLRSVRWLHKRADVDFNGWFMCLIPRVVLRGGRPLAAGLHQVGRLRVRPARQGRPATRRSPSRAPRSGTCRGPTRTTAWTGSPTSTTATGIIAALLHSPYERGGRMVRESLNHQIKHLASLQYSTAELRHLAMEDVLAGPARAARRARPRSWRRSTRSASSSPTPSCTPTATTCRRCAARSRRRRASPTSRSPAARPR